MFCFCAETFHSLIIISSSSSSSSKPQINEIMFEENANYGIHFDFHSNKRSKVDLRPIRYKIKFIDFPDLPQSTPDKLIDSGECNLCAFCAFDLSVLVLFHLQSCVVMFFFCFSVILLMSVLLSKCNYLKTVIHAKSKSTNRFATANILQLAQTYTHAKYFTNNFYFAFHIFPLCSVIFR